MNKNGPIVLPWADGVKRVQRQAHRWYTAIITEGKALSVDYFHYKKIMTGAKPVCSRKLFSWNLQSLL